MKYLKKLVLNALLVFIPINGLAFAELLYDSGTNKWVEENFDIREHVKLPERIIRCAFGKGGLFGDDLYVLCRYGRVFRIDKAKNINLIGSANEDILGIEFSDPNSR